MGPFSMFVEYIPIGSSTAIHDPPVALNAKTEDEASKQAIGKADALYPSMASSVTIRVVGDDNRHPIAKIRRPISN